MIIAALAVSACGNITGPDLPGLTTEGAGTITTRALRAPADQGNCSVERATTTCIR